MLHPTNTLRRPLALASKLLLLAAVAAAMLWPPSLVAQDRPAAADGPPGEAAVGEEASGEEAPTGRPASDEAIARWVAQLNARRFEERESATRMLVAAGRPAIEPLLERLPAATAEGAARGIHVLSELALSDNERTSQGAWDAIEQLAEQRSDRLGRRAADSLAALYSVRKARARELLVKHGARVADRHAQIGGAIVTVVYTVEIPETFSGDLDTLRQLRWLDDVRQVTLRGERVTDAWLEPLAGLEELIGVEVKNSQVTEKGLAHLKALPRLQYLSVYYSPVSDDAVETLAAIKTLAEVRLFGTEMTVPGATRLQQALFAANVDFRQGAFLGVGCQAHPDGAQITIMHDGSAADRAGLRSGDVIQLFDGKKVADFDELKEAIAEHQAGREVVVKVLRSDQPLEFTVKLGEWE